MFPVILNYFLKFKSSLYLKGGPETFKCHTKEVQYIICYCHAGFVLTGTEWHLHSKQSFASQSVLYNTLREENGFVIQMQLPTIHQSKVN